MRMLMKLYIFKPLLTNVDNKLILLQLGIIVPLQGEHADKL